MSNASTGERQDLLEPGTLLDNRYEIHNTLGEGGFSDVYRALRVDTQKPVAIKLLHLPSSRRAKRSFRERFLREAKAASRVSHVRIVDIYGYGVHEDGRPYMALELLDGHTLDEELKHNGPLSKSRAIPLFVDVLDALQAAHSLGIVHRDLKPSNLYINYPDTPEEALHILDFGIAFMSEDNQSRLTQTGQINGTPQYLAPEYIMRQTVSPALDVYQMGLIFVEMFSGQPLVNQDNTYQCFMQHCSGRLDIPTDLLGDALTEVALAALKLDPKERFADAGEFRTALIAATTGRGVLPGADEGPEPTLNDPPPAALQHLFNSDETDPALSVVNGGFPGPSPVRASTPAPGTQLGMPTPDASQLPGEVQPQPVQKARPTPAHTVQGMMPSLDEMRAAATAPREPGRRAEKPRTRRSKGARKAGSGKGAIAGLRRKLAERKASPEAAPANPELRESGSLNELIEAVEAAPNAPSIEDLSVDLSDATVPEYADLSLRTDAAEAALAAEADLAAASPPPEVEESPHDTKPADVGLNLMDGFVPKPPLPPPDPASPLDGTDQGAEDPPDLFDLAVGAGTPDVIGRPIAVGRIVAAGQAGEALSRPADALSDSSIRAVRAIEEPALADSVAQTDSSVSVDPVHDRSPSSATADAPWSLAKILVLAAILAVVVGGIVGLALIF